MAEIYKEMIARLVETSPFDIDSTIEITGKPPTMASSEFLTNKQQGDWAEHLVLTAINENSDDYMAVPYGRSESLAAGDVGFEDFYRNYQKELNDIGKRPDLLIFKKSDAINLDLTDKTSVSNAIAALEVRSSSFLVDKYTKFMNKRTHCATQICETIRKELVFGELSNLLQQKSPEIFTLLASATETTFRELDFRARSWSSTDDLKKLSERLKMLKEQIKILHKRDYLSITPKLEDIVLVNRWIQQFNVRHYYLQVFFDKAYLIPFQSILEISADPNKEGSVFSVEEDVKNQGKTTIKINVQVGQEMIGKIDMPHHVSEMKELDRGRLLFYVKFHGGQGYLDQEVFAREIIDNAK
jgi:type II restriction enzyme